MDEQFGQHFIDLLVDKKLYIFKMHIKFSLHSPKNVHAYVYKHHSKSGNRRTKAGICNDIWIPHLEAVRTVLIIIESYNDENKDENEHDFNSLVECRKTAADLSVNNSGLLKNPFETLNKMSVHKIQSIPICLGLPIKVGK
ncbi:hypothetical protein TURU_089410 [Turdus rufiventris]|nr:hypothetical protein TURU_089410 [Turdus rufiventris]